MYLIFIRSPQKTFIQ